MQKSKKITSSQYSQKQCIISLNVYPKTCRFCDCPPIPGDDFCYGCAAHESD